MDKTLFEQFIEIHPDFKEDLKLLPEKFSLRFIKKFEAEKNKTNFLSLLSEFKFVQFFVNEGFNFEYDTTYFNLKPDIRIKINQQEIIGDIKRFNLSEQDQIKEDFFYQLARKIKKIQKPYHVRIRQIKSFDYKTKDLDSIITDFNIWVDRKDIKIGEIFNFENLFSIEIIKLNGIRDYIVWTSYNTLKNKINPNKILNIINDKITSYEDVFIDKGFPFFVCIDLTFEVLIEPEDFEERYLGDYSLNIDDSTEAFTLGEFYNDNSFSKIIGILIRYNGDFFWIKNPRHPEYINFKTTRDLK